MTSLGLALMFVYASRSSASEAAVKTSSTIIINTRFIVSSDLYCCKTINFLIRNISGYYD